MTTAAESSVELPAPAAGGALPETFLSCYEIVNPEALRWGVRLYKVRKVRRAGRPAHGERGEAKQVIWTLRKKHKDLCRGYGFVIDLDEETVAVPSDWNLPGDVQEGEFQVTFDRALTTDPNDPAHRAIIAGILREAIKARFKNTPSDVLATSGKTTTASAKCRSSRTARRSTFAESSAPPRRCSGATAG